MRLLHVDNIIWVLTENIGLPVYDFEIERFFPVRQPWSRPELVTVIARLGAIADYHKTYNDLLRDGIRLVHTPAEYERCTTLSHWYPLIEDLTPISICFDNAPTANEVENRLRWPVFVKGSRQTARHLRSLSIIENAEQFEAAMKVYRETPLLSWQKIVCREYVPLRSIGDEHTERIPSSFEFRTFWWRGTCVGTGRYWWEGKRYDWSPAERVAGLAVAKEAASRIGVPFLVIDVAQTISGHWIVIECNDGQESGYAGVSPIGLWQHIIQIERQGNPFNGFMST